MEEPWHVISWPPARVQAIYREWGHYYARKLNTSVADLYYDKSLELNPSDTNTLYYRSQCKRSIAQAEQALIDAKKALELDPMRQPFNLQVCDCIYELNQFENSKVSLHAFSRKFQGEKVHAFNTRVDVVDVDISHCTGEALGFFELENAAAMLRVHGKTKEKIDKRPMWKILKSQDKCDVQSFIEPEPVRLSPREIARRIREFRVYNQYYMGRSWVDVMFLRALRADDQLLLKQSQWSAKIIELLTKRRYQTVLRFLKMLQCRSPLYYHIFRAFPNKKLKMDMTESALYHVQYKTHRTMAKTLKSMHELRSAGSIEKLKKYVEQVMGDYVVLKTRRVMPFRFGYINEVYNLLALALLDQLLVVPPNIRKMSALERLRVVLKVPKEPVDKPPVFQFGNRASFSDNDALDRTTLRYRAIETRLEKRIYFSKYPIEKAALWHEIANLHLLQYKLDTCCLTADRCYAEAKKVNSYVWMLLAVMMTCRAHAMIKKFVKIDLAIRSCQDIVDQINVKRVTNFQRLVFRVNRVALIVKRAEGAKLRALSRLYIQNRSSSVSSKEGRASTRESHVTPKDGQASVKEGVSQGV